MSRQFIPPREPDMFPSGGGGIPPVSGRGPLSFKHRYSMGSGPPIRGPGELIPFLHSSHRPPRTSSSSVSHVIRTGGGLPPPVGDIFTADEDMCDNTTQAVDDPPLFSAPYDCCTRSGGGGGGGRVTDFNRSDVAGNCTLCADH